MLNLWERITEQMHLIRVGIPSFGGDALQHLEKTIDTAARALGHSLLMATDYKDH